jgi:drug/metabolite transporter (DMT)-like permease
MVAAMACYVLNDTFVKLTTQHFQPGQILAVRGLFATALVAGIARNAGELRHWRVLLRPIVGVRSLLEISTAATSVAALALASLGIVTAIMMTAPLMITACAMLLGWERPRGLRIVAASTGFVGVLLVMRPFASDADSGWGAAFALLCAASLAARDMLTRAMPTALPTVLIALVTTMAVCLAGLAMALFESWQSLARMETAILAIAAVCAALGNYALIAACRGVDLSVVTPFRYSIVVWAILLSYFVWGETPDATSALGIALISAAGLYAVYSSRRG